MRRTLIALLLAAGCGGSVDSADAAGVPDAAIDAARPPPDAARPAPRGEAWAEADALFRRDPRWLGADAAYSVPLGGERVLWLFGDTFVATSDAHVRTESRMVRNSVAIQTGLCPTSASIAFHWRTAADGTPQSFFPEDGEVWRWPLHGIVVDGALTLFFLREVRSAGGLGFALDGWEAVRIADPSEPPESWVVEPLASFETSFPAAVGVAVALEGEHVLAYVVQEPGGHDIYLLRWARSAFVAGDLSAPEWWTGGAWTAHSPTSTTAPPVIFGPAQTELSVSREADGTAVAIHSVGFGATTIGLRVAPSLVEAFGPPSVVFRPEESDRADAFVYAAKGHPELGCPGDGAGLLVTYVANATSFDVVLRDGSLYYPRFVRVTR